MQLSMSLGVAAAVSAAGTGADPGLGVLGCVLYAVYLTGASLHASTDDQPGDDDEAQRWSGFGLSLASGVLCLWLLFAGIRTAAGDWAAVTALARRAAGLATG